MGRVSLVVNIAGYCALAHTNLSQLAELHNMFASEPFSIVLFPCNDFARQEPRSAEEVRESVMRDYFGHATPLQVCVMEHVHVKPGPLQHPVYAQLSMTLPPPPQWNFTKFLITSQGVPLKRYGHTTLSMTNIQKDIANQLYNGV